MNAMVVPLFRTLQTEKVSLLEQLLSLSIAQKAFIESEDVDGLMENIDNRQEVLDELEEVQKRLRDHPRRLDSDPRLSIEINDLIDKIREADLQNERLVRRQMDDLQGNMKKIAQGRRAGAGYDGHAQNVGAVYFDRRE